jgi:hypothetical protein
MTVLPVGTFVLVRVAGHGVGFHPFSGFFFRYRKKDLLQQIPMFSIKNVHEVL